MTELEIRMLFLIANLISQGCPAIDSEVHDSGFVGIYAAGMRFLVELGVMERLWGDEEGRGYGAKFKYPGLFGDDRSVAEAIRRRQTPILPDTPML